MALFLPRQWNRQPTVPVGLNPTNPLTRELQAALYPIGGAAYDAAERVIGTQTTALVPSSGGMGFSPDGTATAATREKKVTTSGGFTLAALAIPNMRAATIAERLVALYATGGSSFANSSVGYLQIVDTGSKTVVGGHTISTAGTNAVASAALSAANNTGLHLYAVTNTYAVNGIALYIDGVNVGAGTTTGSDGTIWTTQSSGLEVGRLTFQSVTAYGRWASIPLALHWTRVLTALEIRELSLYTWGLFAPLRRPVFFIGAAAAGSSIKTVNGLALASVKTVDGLAAASVKTINGLAAN
jgi:hypothetical protein